MVNTFLIREPLAKAAENGETKGYNPTHSKVAS
jgi:hypothetical protein